MYALLTFEVVLCLGGQLFKAGGESVGRRQAPDAREGTAGTCHLLLRTSVHDIKRVANVTCRLERIYARGYTGVRKL